MIEGKAIPVVNLPGSAYQRLGDWALHGGRVELSCRPDPYANNLPMWTGEARWAGRIDLMVEAGPNKLPEEVCENLIQRLFVGGVVVP